MVYAFHWMNNGNAPRAQLLEKNEYSTTYKCFDTFSKLLLEILILFITLRNDVGTGFCTDLNIISQ